MIAEYGRTEHPATWEPPKGYIHELQQDSSVLEGLVKQRTMLSNQREALSQLPSTSVDAMGALALMEYDEVRKYSEEFKKSGK